MTTTSLALSYLPLEQFSGWLAAMRHPADAQQNYRAAKILAAACRYNTLYMVMQAGSGHLGSSFSSMDLFVWLNAFVLNPQHDVFFSSKGHDAPGLYSVLLALGRLPAEKLHELRQLGGLPGHPDVATTPIMQTNTGSLGMGVAKARGMAWAKRAKQEPGHIYVLTGDGELQEGQFWESLQPTANGKFSNITVIVDHNQWQSDTQVSRVSDLGDLGARIAAHGWLVERCNGHDLQAIDATLQQLKQQGQAQQKPQVLICDTIKGKGVSFMETTAMLDAWHRDAAENPIPLHHVPMYGYHSGAPAAEVYEKAAALLLADLNALCQQVQLPLPQPKSIPRKTRPVPPATAQKQVSAYGEALKALGAKHQNLVALDGDLMLDCGLVPFQQAYPERFIECGIAEMDMVSMAGGLALSGIIPVVHSFACFLSTRPNEHIFNNATEKTKVIYAGSLTGLLPSGPGHSHQSTREISALGSIPNLTMISPCNEAETAEALRWAVEDNPVSTWLRLETVPVDVPYHLPEGYQLTPGHGVVLNAAMEPTAAITLIGYGPVLLSEAYRACLQLKQTMGVAPRLISLPWLNAVDPTWLHETLQGTQLLVTLDNHQPVLGQGSVLAQAILQNPLLCQQGIRLLSLGVEGVPVCGWNHQALAHHGLDADSLAQRLQLVAPRDNASASTTFS